MNLVDTVVKSCEALEGLLRRFDRFHYFYNFDIIFILQKKNQKSNNAEIMLP